MLTWGAAMKSKWLACGLAGFLVLASTAVLACERARMRDQALPPDVRPSAQPSRPSNLVTVFLCGDVMTGRGIDQALPSPSDPLLHEPFMTSALGYVTLAEQAHGPIQRPVSFSYLWGDALQELERVAPDVRIINLETSVTKSDDYWEGKSVHYRMHPQNIPCLIVAGIDCCSLANNHVLDWGYAGLAETLETLERANIKSTGAGSNRQQAEKPAVMAIEGRGRVVVFSYGTESSGIPPTWAAAEDKPGVSLLESLSDEAVQQIKGRIDGVKQEGDVVVFSVHWGSNWGYGIPAAETRFAHRLIDEAGVDLIHGHSSHHVKGMEVYEGKLIIYGCGDFLNDYEGIGGYEDVRPDLALMYFASVDPRTGNLAALQMTPMQISHFRANRVSGADALWLRDVLNREGERLGTRVEMNADHTLTLRWD